MIGSTSPSLRSRHHESKRLRPVHRAAISESMLLRKLVFINLSTLAAIFSGMPAAPDILIARSGREDVKLLCALAHLIDHQHEVRNSVAHGRIEA